MRDDVTQRDAERGSLAVWSFRWRVTPNHRWIQQSRHDGRSASKPSFISAGDRRARGGKAGGHIIRLAFAHRAPSSFSAVILDRAVPPRCVASRCTVLSILAGLWPLMSQRRAAQRSLPAYENHFGTPSRAARDLICAGNGRALNPHLAAIQSWQ